MSRSLVTRLFLVTWIAVTAGTVSRHFWQTPRPTASDFAQVHAAARALFSGQNPYAVVGPGREFEWDFPLLYPLPAVVVALPFAALPIGLADPLFVGVGAGLLAWALTRRRLDNPQLFVFASAAFLFSIQTSQWAPLLTASALLPAMGPLLACKPTVGAALFLVRPAARTLLGALALIVICLAIRPTWLKEWLSTLPAAGHVVAPVWSPFGACLLLSALKWRRAEARLLLAMACVPHTPGLYETIPLFLVVRHAWEGVAMAALSAAVAVGSLMGGPYPTFDLWMETSAAWILWLVYLPCMLMILRRPNVWTDLLTDPEHQHGNRRSTHLDV